MSKINCDVLIVGAGIVSLAIAKSLKEYKSELDIHILEKESEVSTHASGRNSGVLHAGFYYTANSLKAEFSVKGNRELTKYCIDNKLDINQCGKLVVATNADEEKTLYELEKRGHVNGADVSIVTLKEAKKIEPNVKSYNHALWSPNTATVNPNQLNHHLRDKLMEAGVKFHFNEPYLSFNDGEVKTENNTFKAKYVVNSAGLFADKIAKDFGLSKNFTIMPFKGLYLKYTKNKTDLKTNIYPVPNLKNPFLGVHYTITVDGAIKIGPTAIPAFWREHYGGLDNFSLGEASQIIKDQAKLFLLNSFNFRSLAVEEMKKYRKKYFISLATALAENIDPNGFTEWTKPGIRAQLLDKRDNKLVQDFVIEHTDNSLHILNAVSPGYTCSFPFGDYIVDKYVKEKF